MAQNKPLQGVITRKIEVTRLRASHWKQPCRRPLPCLHRPILQRLSLSPPTPCRRRLELLRRALVLQGSNQCLIPLLLRILTPPQPPDPRVLLQSNLFLRHILIILLITTHRRLPQMHQVHIKPDLMQQARLLLLRIKFGARVLRRSGNASKTFGWVSARQNGRIW